MLRTPPVNVEAEKALLGAIFLNNRAYDRVAEILLPEHFALEQNQTIYKAITALLEKGKVADPVTLRNLFQQSDSLADIGGPAYLAELSASACGVTLSAQYGKIIVDLYQRRQLLGAAEELVDRIYTEDPMEATAEALQEAHEKRLFEIAASVVDGREGPKHIGTFADIALRDAETASKQGGLVGVSTGLLDLDTLLGGLHDSDLIVVAGRPGMGKTALATTIAFNVAESHSVLVNSLEMSGDQIALREIGARSGVSSYRLRGGKVMTGQMIEAIEAGARIKTSRLFVDDRPGLSIQAIRTVARRMKRQHDIRLLVVDYLQLVSAKAENRTQEIGAITRQLKGIAKELKIPVLVLSQLSRKVEERDDKRPQLGDLRESGDIEQDADVVAFIYREEYYLGREKPAQRLNENNEAYNSRLSRWDERMEKCTNKAEVIVAKQRHGPTGSREFYFDGATTKFKNFREAAPDYQEAMI